MVFRVVIFYLVMWFFLILLGGFQQETGLLPPEIGLPQLGPGIAGLLMLLLFRKDQHRMVFYSKSTPVMRYVMAALVPFAVGLVAFLIKALFSIQATQPGIVFESLPLALLWMPLGALGEEIGWRGYLHKKLESRMRGLFSSLLVGVLWAPIHVHFFGLGAWVILLLFIMIVAYSVVLYAMIHDAQFSILLATIFHLAINLTNLLFLDVIYEASFMAVISLSWAVVAFCVIAWKHPLYLQAKKS